VSVGVCFVLFCPLDHRIGSCHIPMADVWWLKRHKHVSHISMLRAEKTSSKPCSLGVPLRSDVSRWPTKKYQKLLYQKLFLYTLKILSKNILWPTLDTLKIIKIYSSSDPQQLTVRLTFYLTSERT
jgi:hypothetical protein